jgi:HD superfamily phosphohydrolase
MLVVHEGELMVEEKAIYSIEKFLVARRLMYWQVYLHKTVLVAEKMVIKITERVREIYKKEDTNLVTGTAVDYFLSVTDTSSDEALKLFSTLDDYDFVHALKVWSRHPDKVLQLLCNGILNRQLLKIKFQSEPFNTEICEEKKKIAREKLGLSDKEIDYFVFTGKAVNTMYKTNDESINILFKDGQVKDISQVDNALIQKSLSSPVKKFYICFLG